MGNRAVFLMVVIVAVIAGALLAALLVNIVERKSEARSPYLRLVEVGEDDTDPAKWGTNWPRQYDSYRRTARATRTRFGGHGGSEALPEQKIERDPWLKRMFLGYAFSIDYRDRRGHAYMLEDQENTRRQEKPQSGSCLHCHASVMPLYRKLGDGDAVKGFEKSHAYSYRELNRMLHEDGQAHPVSCVDCHDPQSMRLRVVRPGFIQGIRMLADSGAPVPHLPSVERWREEGKARPYDPNAEASRTEMRSFVCAQCHVEYYCGSEMKLTFPWGEGLRVEDAEKFWDETSFAGGERFFRLRAHRDRRAGPQGAAPRVRALEPGHPRAQRGGLRRTATCPICATGRARSRTTGCGALCSISIAPVRPATISPKKKSGSASPRFNSATSIYCSAPPRRSWTNSTPSPGQRKKAPPRRS